MTFSLAYYESMLANIAASGRIVLPVADALALDPAHAAAYCVMRHDVDRVPARAVRMAKLEQEHGIRSTYYFRCTRNDRFPNSTIEEIAGCGHEVGLHYETLSRCKGDVGNAVEAFKRELAAFRAIAPCTTVSMHGAPLSRFNNQDLVAYLDFDALGLKGDAVAHVQQRLKPVYITDTGGAWNAGGSRNLRDVAGDTTADVPDLSRPDAALPFLTGIERLLYLSCHPERWPATVAGRAQVFVADGLANFAKLLLRTSAPRNSRT
jgi:hypothetical protein